MSLALSIEVHNHCVSDVFIPSVGCVLELVIQFMFTGPLSCNVTVVALLFSYLLLFNEVLAGRGDTVMFLQTRQLYANFCSLHNIFLYIVSYTATLLQILYILIP